MTLAHALDDTSDLEADAIAAVIAAGRTASARHWVPATSGNFSVRIDDSRIAITRSGVDKGALRRSDVSIQELSAPLRQGSSAEALLHVRLYHDHPEIHAVSHTHGLASAVIGRAHAEAGVVRLHGWELQKAFAGVTSHDDVVEVPVFANDQDMAVLSERVAERLAASPGEGSRRAPGYLLAGHGIYAWGRTANEAARHIEAFEALFTQMLAFRSFQP